MDFKPSNDSTAEKRKQNMLLVVLLILVAAFAYIYFFTGLIKPQEAPKPVETPAPQVVKKPLPPRDEKPAAAGSTTATPGAPGPQKNAVATAKPEPRKVTEPPKEPQKPEPAKTSKATPLEKKLVTPEKKGVAPVAKETKTLVAKPQPTAAVNKPVPAKENEKVAKAVVKAPAATSGPAKKPEPAARHEMKKVKAVPDAGKGPWTVVVGSYVLEDAMASDMVRIRGARLEAAVKDGGRRKTAMNRLLAGEYPNRAEAQKELDILKQHTSDAFILDQGGKFAVYAGSYLLMERADSEKERLAAAGVRLTIRHADVSIPAKVLTAGTFSDKKTADAAVSKLKGIGLKPSLSRF